MWKGGMGELREGTVSGRGWVRRRREVGRRRVRGKEKGERKNNGVFRGLAFCILTSQLVCVCVCVCVCVLYFSLNVMTVLMED